ncbi:hypothetical protein O0Q50_21165 [Priestia aryabhattai]|uniref:Uncharacterized protein n=1 Tax=Priestia aryabhattai TaxID=412384 RepID=A0AAX6NDF5_PRIAR|nr:hypothetical protein [Priestia aryabhattai]MDU9693690.1 hypothetical protein [Priestia aryabhattai]
MVFLLVVALLILVLFINLNKRMGKIIETLPEDLNNEDLIELPNERAYYDETNKAIIDLKKKIDKAGIDNKDIVEIRSLKKLISRGYTDWEGVQEELSQMIEERTAFVSQGNFYPREYAFDINRMRTEIEKAREFQLNNPLKSLEEIKAFIKEQNDKVSFYKEIKGKVEIMLIKLEKYEKGLKTKKETIPYFNKKQELFIHLQNGDLKAANKILKELKGRVKNIS